MTERGANSQCFTDTFDVITRIVFRDINTCLFDFVQYQKMDSALCSC